MTCSLVKHNRMFSGMDFTKHFLFAILVVQSVLVSARDQLDFISIDCGVSEGTSYTDENTGISYVSDVGFTEFGESRLISPAYHGTVERQFWNVRSFPQGTRNCYTLTPSQGKGMRYLIRARFMYGNYDIKNQNVTFDLYLGVELWHTVEIESQRRITTTEVIYTASSSYIHVCLVNTGNGVPFISVLELRPVGTEIYTSGTGTYLKLLDRYDFSSTINEIKRYNDDVYDRLWRPLFTDAWYPFLNVSFSDESVEKNHFQVPTAVMSTAYTKNRSLGYMSLLWSDLDSSSRYFVYMHFAELEILQSNESREFNIFINNELFYANVSPSYLQALTILSTSGRSTDQSRRLQFWINNTDRATLPPLINAIEIFIQKELSGQDTNQTDAEAISDIKSVYGLKRVNWQGDPCGPEDYQWDGINCSYTANDQSRIVYLNLSSSGLKGKIAFSIANLTMLEYLDLSNNNLTGTVPEFLAQLSFLRTLNLKGNNFTGSLPDALIERSENDLLLLISSDTDPSSTYRPRCSSGSCSNKKKFVVPMASSLGGLCFVVLIAAALIWTVKRRKVKNAMVLKGSTEEDRSLVSKKQRFLYSEIGRITNNFERVLGEGGFGKVYHGNLDGVQVAVKMLSSSSVQGHQQFNAELRLLMRVHHKNLMSLIGYCCESAENIGLIYEYMAMGNLKSHLSGCGPKILSWRNRLRIAVDAAQGLEYLHNGCKPPIVHRDVKSTNILLNEDFQAKLSDFGLSKILPFEGDKHILSHSRAVGISTSVAGTPGYVDPEYYVSNKLSEKSDVYGFGVVLLEIITARQVLVKTRENNHISEWVSFMLANGDIDGIVDPKLDGDFDKNTVWKAIDVAMACVSRTSTNRPSMTRVTAELKECLTSETTRILGHYGADSKDFAPMVTETLPSAR